VAGLTSLDGAGGKLDIETALVVFGTALLRLILSPRVVVMSHMLMGMLMKDHRLAEAFYEAGPRRLRGALAEFLTEVAAEEGLEFDSAQLAADDLVSLWEGDMQKQLALGRIPPITPADIERRVRRGTAVFLRAYRGNPEQR
jgi:TetR/AcrR family transcriptional repressor of mexJK operon